VSGGSECAVVGGGLAGFTAYATLIHGGIAPEEITVFDAGGTDPARAWRRRAAAIRQRRMRSESDGHCLPASFPGLAVLSAWRRRSLGPLVASVCDRYHPTVEEFLDHVEALRLRIGWDTAVVRSRVECVHAVDHGFSLGEQGTFRHVLLAVGPSGPNIPEELADDARAVHAYEPHDYADDVAVVGAGMAAATEWRNALAAGARVT
jgi:cation diffusion facilitator CzcD-associated flavoprotein CzcO